MRDLIAVIDAMLTHVPETSASFRRALEEAKTTDEYLAPVELSHEHWSSTARVLAGYIPAIPQHRQPWQVEVMKVWNVSEPDDFQACVVEAIRAAHRRGLL